jgi:hypothetical protein
MANRTQNTNLEAENLETGEGLVESTAKVTLAKSLKALRSAESGEAVDVAKRKVGKPAEAYKKLEEALKYVKGYFGKTLKINLDEISFKKFGGNQVGESTEEGAFVDPIMLLHPAIRLAHVIAHELAHDKKKILNEGLVESYVHAFFGEDGTNHTYETATAKFEEFAKKCTNKGDDKETTKKLYELYYTGRFEKIYEMFEKNHLSNLETNTEKDEAFKLFQEVFPELHYEAKKEKAGYFDVKRPV